MSLGTNRKKVRDLQRKRANQRMRDEVAPLLKSPLPRLSGWNPLQTGNESSDYGLELKLSSTGAQVWQEIMASDSLMDKVDEIAINSVHDAALAEPRAFVTDVLSSLIGNG